MNKLFKLYSGPALVVFVAMTSFEVPAASIDMPVTFGAISKLGVSIPTGEHRYGPEPTQYAVRLENVTTANKNPIILIHGGCWSNQYSYQHQLPLAEALVSRGHAVWLLEYRRVGDVGGGWPGTRDDVINGVQSILATDQFSQSPWLIGHSAGGHLALLAAEAMAATNPDALAGVVALAPITDVQRYGANEGSCPEMATALMSSVPEIDRETAMVEASPGRRSPPLPVLLVRGSVDPIVGADQTEPLADFETVDAIEISGAGHFDLIHPGTEAFEHWYQHLLAL